MPKTLVLGLFSVLLMTACSTVVDMPIGSSITQIQQKFGPPSVACPTVNPTRFVWSSQPLGQYAWGVDIDPQQGLQQATQVLNDQEFTLLNQGEWNQERVLCHFGPPAEKDITPYQGVKMHVWSYRYKQNQVWDSMMYVYFNDAGIAKHHHPGPDPSKIRDGSFFVRF